MVAMLDCATLKELYWDKEMSLREICGLTKVPTSTIRSDMENYNIPRRSVSEAKKLQWSKQGFKEKMRGHLQKMQRLSQTKEAIAKIKHTKLGVSVTMPVKKMPHLHDLLITYVLLNPAEFGYQQTCLIQTANFDLVGLKTDGTLEKIEIEECGADFLTHHHNAKDCDRIITYYKTNRKMPLPVIAVNKKKFLLFADKIYTFLRGAAIPLRKYARV